MSLPAITGGIVANWMGVGVSYPAFCTFFRIMGIRPRDSKLMLMVSIS
jgi:hypothetical protein